MDDASRLRGSGGGGSLPQQLVEQSVGLRRLATPLREFLATENASALALLTATVVALVWANSPWSSSYERLWTTRLAFRLGGSELALDLRHWVNDGLMAGIRRHADGESPWGRIRRSP